MCVSEFKIENINLISYFSFYVFMKYYNLFPKKDVIFI